MNGFLVFGGIIGATALGDYFLKLASLKEAALRAPEFWLGASLYMATALGFLYAMRHMNLAAIGVWYAMLTILVMAALGVIVFRESLTPREIAGVVMALGAVVLMGNQA